MLVRRDPAPVLFRTARRYPFVTLTGPRQSGKTTLCRQVCPRLPHVDLERIDDRAYATQDPRGFRADRSRGAIFESWVASEIQGAHTNRGNERRGVECTSGRTFALGATQALQGLPEAMEGIADVGRGILVYGGEKRQRRTAVDVVPWHALSRLDGFRS